LLLREAERAPQQAAGAAGDLLEGPPADAGEQGLGGGESAQQPAERPGGPDGAGERHWRRAMDQARTVARTTVAGREPAGIARELGAIGAAQLDWRTYLWRYLTQTPTDFGSYDRRFVGDELYLETLAGESARVLVAIDTSGSVAGADVQAFLGELRGILQAYPLLRCELYYADAAIYGPYALTARDLIPPPVGGGGTDFRPFLAAADRHQFAASTTVAIYLTDGYGSFPERAPRVPVLWVVTPGGRDLGQFPFGETVRLLRSAHTPFVRNVEF
jgi:predicted metal-dependent peptidase